jgi:hypothetical protein
MNKLLLVLLLTLTPAAFAHVWYVDGVNGNDTNDCKTRQNACKTIGHAISLASSGDTIGVGPATYTENLTIGIDLKLIGSGSSTTIIDGGGANTVVTVERFATNVNVILSKFTIRNGNSGIVNTGTLTINHSTVTGNKAGGMDHFFIACGGGGIYNPSGTLIINASTISSNQAVVGGGICNSGTLTINGSTLSDNTASYNGVCGPGYGGGIQNVSGAIVINDSTLTGNTARSSVGDHCSDPAYGGGIYNYGGGVTINNSTISNNSAQGEWGGVGGGIYGNAILRNSIVAYSFVGGNSGGNCSNTLTSDGYNLSSDGTCNFTGPGDLNNTNPLLGPLQNNGGPTQTQALLPGSPAIDAGNPNGCTDGSGHLLKTDQRGAPRPNKEDTGGCDMGAYERQSD